MIRGVNRKIIEVKDTGSSYFERILLFVKNEQGNMAPQVLDREADRLVKSLTGSQERDSKWRGRGMALPLGLGAAVGAVLTGLAVKIF